MLLVSTLYNPLLAQINTTKVTGHAKASYTAAQTGKFMTTWLVAGPVSVGTDTVEPVNALREKVFKEDLITSISLIYWQVRLPKQWSYAGDFGRQ